MIIGELLNSSRKVIKPLVVDYNENALLEIARAEITAGADYLDFNCGTFIKDEPDRLTWLVNTVGAAIDAPICLDSPNPEALKAALPLVKGQAMINSISAEKHRYESILPLALEFKTKIIALCMDDSAIPQSAEDRYRIGADLIERLATAGMPLNDIYLDPLVQPVSVSVKGALIIFDTIRRIKESYPEVHCLCGLSNISFGLPNRKIINRYFLAQAIAAGMDSFILDPTDRHLMGAYWAAKALVGEDRFCANYLKAHRKGLYND